MKYLIALIFIVSVLVVKAANPTFPDMINFANQVTNKNYVDVRLFGAVADNATPSDVAFRMAYTNALALNQPIFIQGQYYLTNSFVVTNRGMTFFSFSNPNDFATGPNSLPDVCVHFGSSAVDGFIFKEMSAAEQSDNGHVQNIAVFMENTNGAGFVFASTNGTSDGMIFNNVSVKSGLIPFAGGIGFNVRFGVSEGHFNDVYPFNCRVGFMITNEFAAGVANAGINQGDTIFINAEGCGTVMEIHSLQGAQITFNHISTLGKLLAFEGCQGVDVFCGHIEHRGVGRSVISSVGKGSNAIKFRGAVEDWDNSWCFEAQDDGTFGSTFTFDNFTFGGHTNISGGVCWVKLNHPDNAVQSIFMVGCSTREALYSGVTLLSSNAPAALGTIWGGALVSWPNLPKGFLQWDFSSLPARLFADRQTNQSAVNYERLYLNQYDDDSRAGLIVNAANANLFTKPQSFAAAPANSFANSFQASTTNIGGDNHVGTAGVMQVFRGYNNVQDFGVVGGYAPASASSFGGAMFIAPNDDSADHTYLRDVFQVWFDRTVHIGGVLIVSNSAFIPTNTAPFNFPTETFSINNSFTNKSGARAILHINAVINDAVASTPQLVISNFTRGVVWTNSIAGVSAVIPWSMDYFGWSTNDVGGIYDKSTGSATISINKAQWITQ